MKANTKFFKKTGPSQQIETRAKTWGKANRGQKTATGKPDGQRVTVNDHSIPIPDHDGESFSISMIDSQERCRADVKNAQIRPGIDKGIEPKKTAPAKKSDVHNRSELARLNLAVGKSHEEASDTGQVKVCSRDRSPCRKGSFSLSF